MNDASLALVVNERFFHMIENCCAAKSWDEDTFLMHYLGR